MKKLGVWMALLLVGCPGSLSDEFYGDSGTANDTGTNTDSGTTPTSLCNLSSPAQVVADSCATANCHDGTFPPDLQPANFPTLVGQAAVRTGCDGEVYIDGANPENSLVYKIVVADSVCGDDLMPVLTPGQLDADPDTDAALKDCLKDWVTEVAGGGQ